ncbi:ADRA1B [Bugula neritina]|uniref:ADRA1B n=1 Tax=Bugula neritina TaxID=10212 RepID=A0A7J7JDF0_BUGNE|nr:ADRA1B [Bugula neritina]
METDGLLDLNYTASPMLSDLGSQSIGLLTVLILICTATILGNLSVIIAIRVNRKLRARPTYHFIQSLAAADLALGVFVLPFSISLQIQQQWLFGDILCSVWAASDVLCCTASILSLCAISLERYLGVTQPLKHRSQLTKKRSYGTIVAIWLFSLVISVIGPVVKETKIEMGTRLWSFLICWFPFFLILPIDALSVTAATISKMSFDIAFLG